jgi:hypothetical protein
MGLVRSNPPNSVLWIYWDLPDPQTVWMETVYRSTYRRSAPHPYKLGKVPSNNNKPKKSKTKRSQSNKWCEEIIMLRLLWQGLRASPVAVSAALLLCNSTLAQTVQEVSGSETADPTSELLQQIEEYNPVDLSQGGDEPLEQVNFVNQLRDVKPTDWAFTALQNLAQRHQCLLAYPDGTYRGNRAMTRYEFAAGLDACLEQIQLQLANLDTGISAADLETLRRLQEEFAGELTILRRRVDSIEVRTAELEANQFSTTTKLGGEVLFALVDAFGNQDETVSEISGGEDVETSFGYRVRLTLDSSFTGKDRLRTRLQARNMARLDRPTGTAMARLGFDGENGTDLSIDRLEYRFPLTDTVRMNVGAIGFQSDRFAPILNPLFESSGGGAISRYGRRNPAVHRTPDGGAGVGFEIKPSNKFRIDLGYLSGNSNRPISKNGLFNGAYSAFGQLTVSPTENVDVAFSYVNSYAPGDDVNVTGTTGSGNARRPFGRVATSGNHFGLQTSINLSPVTISAWGGYTSAQAEDGPDQGNKADIWNWLVSLGVEDLGVEGDQLGFIVGMPPKLTDIDNGTGDSATSLHLEALYRYPISSKIDITPGFFLITNPNHNDNNDTVWVGTLRTRFRF